MEKRCAERMRETKMREERKQERKEGKGNSKKEGIRKERGNMGDETKEEGRGK